MLNPNCCAILGVGHALGSIIRDNSDPVFDYIHAHPDPNSDIFAGLKYRRVLDAKQSVVTIMVDAAHHALANANVQPEAIGLLIGAGSVSDNNAPNALAAVHANLQLPNTCRVLALNSEYTTFLDAMKIANDMIAAGSITNALVVCGTNWTQHMDYTESVCVAASDAAGAAVVGASADPSKFHLVDWDHETDTSYYGALRMAPRLVDSSSAPPPRVFTNATMKIDAATGRNAIMNFGIPAPPRVVARLLARNEISAADMTLVPHQVATLIAEKWKTAIAPALYVSTHEELADMVSASVPVNLSLYFDMIPTNHLVLLGIGMEMNTTALLYSRTATNC
ncbi:MAG: hypothetical protein ABI120_21195 [Gemmatimonadaceae bacterium]